MSVLVLAGLFAVNAYQANSYEYLSTREVLVRDTLALLDSNDVEGIHFIREAVEMLVQLGAVDRINQTAILEFLNSIDYAGLIDNVHDCLLTLKALGRLDLMDGLLGNTSALHTMIINQYTGFDMPTYVLVAQFFG